MSEPGINVVVTDLWLPDQFISALRNDPHYTMDWRKNTQTKPTAITMVAECGFVMPVNVT